jgi:hypothetical protein
MQLSKLDSVMCKHEKVLGGGEGIEGVYGSLTSACMADVFGDWPGFGSNSILLDVGCGIGRPQVQALCTHGVSHSVGVEIDIVKCDKAVPFIQRAAQELGLDASCIKILHTGGTSGELTTLEPCTHLYLCWQGWSDIHKAQMGALVAQSASVFCVCMVQHRFSDDQPAGWPELQLVNSRPVRTVGGGETLHARTFVVAGRSQEPASMAQAASGGLLSEKGHVPEVGRTTRGAAKKGCKL